MPCPRPLILMFALVISFAIAPAHDAAAQSTHLVPLQFPSIQAAITAAASGDTILVSPGIYFESLDLGTKELILRSTNGAAATEINGSLSFLVLRMAGNQTPATELDGFSIRFGRGSTPPSGSMVPAGPGGLLIESASPTIKNCIFDGNVGGNGNTTSGGSVGNAGAPGAVKIVGGSPFFENCEFRNNSGGRGGDATMPFIVFGIAGRGGPGAVYAAAPSGAPATPVFRRCLFINNFGGAGGDETFSDQNGWSGAGGAGALFNTSTHMTMESCAVVENFGGPAGTAFGVFSVQFYGGAGAYDGRGQTGCDFLHLTVADNQIGAGPPGPSSAGLLFGNNALLHNSVVWFNTGSSAPQVTTTAGLPTAPIVTRSNVEGGYPGPGNIDADPLFVDASLENYRLQGASPSRNAGDINAITLPSFDLDGEPRLVLPAPDQGAYEINNLKGSEEDLTLTTRVNFGGDADFPVKEIMVGDSFEVKFESPGGTFDHATAALFGQIFLPTSPPLSPLAFPELEINLPGVFVLFNGSSFGPAIIGPNGYTFVYVMPPLSGMVLRLQAAGLTNLAANSIFASSPSHDLIVF